MADSKRPRRPGPAGKPAAKPAPVRGKQGYSVGAQKPARRRPGGMLIAGGLVAVAAAVIVAIAAMSVLGGGSQSYAAGLKAGDCTTQTFPKADPLPGHLADGEKPPKYDSDPPVDGKHDATPAVWGIYDQPLDQSKLIHNMEHAGMVVQYGDKVPASTVAKLTSDVRNDPEWTVLASYPKLGDKIAFERWAYLVECTSYQKGVLTDFRKHRNVPGPSTESQQGPRDWSQEARQPGL
jgi:uncharacterized protein DUF3105